MSLRSFSASVTRTDALTSLTRDPENESRGLLGTRGLPFQADRTSLHDRRLRLLPRVAPCCASIPPNRRTPPHGFVVGYSRRVLPRRRLSTRLPSSGAQGDSVPLGFDAQRVSSSVRGEGCQQHGVSQPVPDDDYGVSSP